MHSINMKLLFATTNQDKLREVYYHLGGVNVSLLRIDDFKKLHNVVVEESGETFEENSLLKAKTYGDLAQVLTIAEDAGLEVDALSGLLGVRSARFGSDTNDRNQKLLKMLGDEENRSARFISVFCLYNPQTQKAKYFRGEIQGQIAKKISGEQGFGYDHVFIPQGYKQTFAELGDKVKNKISHRQQALEKLKTLMLSLSGE